MNALTSGRCERLVGRVHEQRARERLVGAVLDRVRVGLACSSPLVADADQVELVGVLLVVGEAEVAEAALGAGDAGHELVVVLGGLVVLARRALLTVDLLGEEVERAGVGARAEERERLLGQAVAGVAEVRDLGLRLPELPSAGRR